VENGLKKSGELVGRVKTFLIMDLVIYIAQWENISISSVEVDFWGVKSSGCENSHATEVKSSNIPQKSQISYRNRSEMNVKDAGQPKFSGFHSSFAGNLSWRSSASGKVRGTRFVRW
jgi:hypothetical protein